MTDPDPRLTPDGRYLWNGERWVATALQTRRLTVMFLLIFGGLVVAVLGLMVLVMLPAIIEMFRVFS